MNKMLLYIKIRKFYKTFGEDLGSNFITKLSDITNDNLYDVLYDIDRVLQACIACDAYQTFEWIISLQSLILFFRENNKYPVVLHCTLKYFCFHTNCPLIFNLALWLRTKGVI